MADGVGNEDVQTNRPRLLSDPVPMSQDRSTALPVTGWLMIVVPVKTWPQSMVMVTVSPADALTGTEKRPLAEMGPLTPAAVEVVATLIVPSTGTPLLVTAPAN